jgi:hypothetical protein
MIQGTGVGIDILTYFSFGLFFLFARFFNFEFFQIKNFERKSIDSKPRIILISTLLFSLPFLFIALLISMNSNKSLFYIKKIISLFINFWPSNERWLDSNIMSKSIICGKKINLYEQNSCFGFLWNYPALFKYLPDYVGINSWLIPTITLSSAFIIFIIFIRFSQFRLIITMLFLLSPGVIFAIERANPEFLVLLIAIISSFLVGKLGDTLKLWPKIFIFLMLFILINMNVSLKFYPIGLTLIFIILGRTVYFRIYMLLSFIFCLIFSIKYLDLLKFYPNAPSPKRFSYGLVTLFKSISMLDSIQLFILIMIIPIVGYKILGNIINLNLITKSKNYLFESKEISALAPMMLFFGVFIMGGNTVYRSMLLMPCLFLNSKIFENKVIVGFALLISWTSEFDIFSNFLILLLIFFMIKFKILPALTKAS